MIKRALVVIAIMFILAACNKEEKQVENVGAELMISMAEFSTIEDISKWSDTIVKAKYLRKEEFDSSTAVFVFETEEDFVGNVEEREIHVYESAQSSFIEGKSYYLFLSSFYSKWYPHVVYRRVSTGFLMGEKNKSSTYTFYQNNDMGLKAIDDMNEYIMKEIVDKKSYMQEDERLGESLEEICENADAVTLIEVLEVKPQNQYVALCTYEVKEVLRNRYVEEFDGETEELLDEVKEAAGSRRLPSVPAAITTEVGDQFLLIERYDEETKDYKLYAEGRYLYSFDSTEGQFIANEVRTSEPNN